MGMFKTLALGVVGFSVYSALRRQSRAPANSGKSEPPLQRWEDEGGNVPAANPALQTAGADPADGTMSARGASRGSAL